jgi:hypothetical protein
LITFEPARDQRISAHPEEIRMRNSGNFSLRYRRSALIGTLIVCTVSAWACKSKPQKQPAPAVQPLSANDVSWLFPAPTQAADFANLIAVRDITTPDPQDPTKRDPVWPDAVFQQFLAIADSPAAQAAPGATGQIALPKEAQTPDAWFVAGVRIDAGAPGLSSDIRGQYGQLPEIRLIIQPIIKNPDGSPKVLDIAGHLIFDFINRDARDARANRLFSALLGRYERVQSHRCRCRRPAHKIK